MSRSKRARRVTRQLKALKARTMREFVRKHKDACRVDCSTYTVSRMAFNATPPTDLHDENEVKMASVLLTIEQLVRRYRRFRVKWRKAMLLGLFIATLLVIFEVAYLQHLALAIFVESVLTRFGTGALEVAEEAAA